MTRRSSPAMALAAALAMTVAACDSDPGAQVTQRDVYSGPNALNDCVADWGNEELCKQQIDDAEKKRLAENAPGGAASHGANPIFIYGPGYIDGARTASHNGVSYTPTSQRATQSAAFKVSNSGVKPMGFSAPKAATPGVTRGGFGATGRGFGGGG